jgi:VWFA-related protein
MRRILTIAAVTVAAWVPNVREGRAQDDGVLRVNTQLVLVDVVVRNRDGAVTGLKEDDFHIFDNGSEQSIAVFEAVSGDPEPADAAQLPAGARSNRRNSSGNVPASATAILIDRLNTETDAQVFVNQRLNEFLATFDRRDGIAIYELGNELRLLHDYTEGPDHLLEVAGNLQPEHSLSLASSDSSGGFEADLSSVGLDRGLSEDFLQSNSGFDRRSSDYFLNERALKTSVALETIVRRLQGLPGRKNLVWLSGRFPFAFDARRRGDLANEVENTTLEQLESVGVAIVEANVAIYPVDVRGPGGEGADVGTISEHIADRTGGRTFRTNGVETAVDAAVTDAEMVYTLGFYPSVVTENGGFREIRVEVAGEDLQIRYRPGYFGFAGGTLPAPRVGLADLLVSPLDAGAVGLTGIAGKAADGSGYQLVAIVDAHDLSLVSIGGRRLGVVDIAMAFRASDGQAYVLPAETQSVNLTDAQFAEAEAGFIIRKGINTEGQTGSIRIVVRDQATGAAGSVWIPAD